MCTAASVTIAAIGDEPATAGDGPSGTMACGVGREARRERRGEPGVHHQQALPAVEERDAPARRPRAGRRSRRPPPGSARPARRSRARRRAPAAPMNAQTRKTSPGEPSARAIAGRRQEDPDRRPAADDERGGGRQAEPPLQPGVAATLRTCPQAELEGPRPARAEDAARRGERVAEATTSAGSRDRPGRSCRARARWRSPSSCAFDTPRMFVTLKTLKHLDDRLEAAARRRARSGRDSAQVERVEAVAEARVVAHERQRHAVDAARRRSAS